MSSGVVSDVSQSKPISLKPITSLAVREWFKMAADYLDYSLTTLFHEVRATEFVTISWNQTIVVRISKKDLREACDNHRGINLNPVVTNLFGSVMIDRLTS